MTAVRLLGAAVAVCFLACAGLIVVGIKVGQRAARALDGAS